MEQMIIKFDVVNRNGIMYNKNSFKSIPDKVYVAVADGNPMIDIERLVGESTLVVRDDGLYIEHLKWYNVPLKCSIIDICLDSHSKMAIVPVSNATIDDSLVNECKINKLNVIYEGSSSYFGIIDYSNLNKRENYE